jgi:hypothetical protein
MEPIQYEVAVVDLIEEAWASVELSSDLVVEVQLDRLPAGTVEGDTVCFRSLNRGWEPTSFRLCPEALLVSNPRAKALTNNRSVQ